MEGGQGQGLKPGKQREEIGVDTWMEVAAFCACRERAAVERSGASDHRDFIIT